MSGDTSTLLQREFGRAISAKEVAEFFHVDPRTVKKYAHELGGVYLLGRLTFFENRVRERIDALQNNQAREDALARLRQTKRATGPKAFRHKNRGPELGGGGSESCGCPARIDPYGIFGGMGK
jgi:hypothetical protein